MPFSRFVSRLRGSRVISIGVLVVVPIVTVLGWNAFQEGRLRSGVVDASNRGLLFLEKEQRPSGEFPTYVWALTDPASRFYAPATFTASQLLHSLTFVDGGEIGRRIKDRTIGYLQAEQDPPALWRFYGKSRRELISPDADDTAQAWAALSEQGMAVDPRALEILKAFRNSSGLFSTWLDPPESRYGADSLETDMVVNLNIFFLFSLLGEPLPEVCRQVTAYTKAGTFQEGTVYYFSPLAYTYFLSRAYADGGGSCLEQVIPEIRSYTLSHQHADGSWGTALETALAILTLLNTGERGSAVRHGIVALLSRQQPDGAWDLAPLYQGANGKTLWGSQALTTGLSLEALAKYLSQAKAPHQPTENPLSRKLSAAG